MISPGKSSTPVKVITYTGSESNRRKDAVAVEEPLEIRVEDSVDGAVRTTTLSVTMRTPGDDFPLAAGFLFGEGLLAGRDEVAEISYCMGEEPQHYNIVSVRLKPGVLFEPGDVERNFYMTSSCGVCGKASLEAIEIRGCAALPDGEWALEPDLLAGIPEALRARQGVFDRTGGIHAAGLFGKAGDLMDLREDVGRHNAVDKIVGSALLSGDLPLSKSVLAVSGRVSFDILQKVVAAQIPVVVAVGAPSSLAVDLARRFNITLVGFLRGKRFNVYSGDQRLAEAS